MRLPADPAALRSLSRLTRRSNRRLGWLAALTLLLPALLLLSTGGPPTWPVADAQPVSTATAPASGGTGGGGSTAPPLPQPPSTPVQRRGVTGRVALAGPGAVLAWGDNQAGELGDATNLSTSTAIQTQGLSGVRGIAGSLGPNANSGNVSLIPPNHSLAVRRDGTVAAWGLNSNGQLGDGTVTNRNVPVPVVGLPNDPIIAVAAGGAHSLALGTSGKVYAWGSGLQGQLGDGNQLNNSPVTTVTVAVNVPLVNIVAIAAGYHHSLAVSSSGAVYAWGSNSFGQLGQPSAGGAALRAVPVAPAPGGINQLILGSCTAATCSVAAGRDHSLAMMSLNGAFAWGSNSFGQLGDGTTTQRTTPVAVKNSAGTGPLLPVAIAAGAIHSVAIEASSTNLLSANLSVLAWGWNAVGQLGDGTTTDRALPVAVTRASDNSPLTGTALAGTGFTAVAAGVFHSVAMSSGGAVFTWGANDWGELGDGTLTDQHRAVPVLNVSGVTAIAAGAANTLALGPDFPQVVPTATTPANTTGSSLVFINPVRVVETRPTSGTIVTTGFDGNGNQITAGPFQDGDTRTYRIAGKTFQGFTIPAGAKGIAFTLTAVQNAPSGGFLAVFPGGAAAPATSTLNPSGATGVTAVGGSSGLDATGNVQIKSVGAVRDVILDVSGYYQ